MKSLYASPVSPMHLDGDRQKFLSPGEIEVWDLKLRWIWNPTQAPEVRQRSGCCGPLFLAQLDGDLCLHLGVGRDGVDLCAVWRGDECVMWNNLIGFCSVWPPAPTWERTNNFDAQIRTLIRRNCFLLGSRIEVTPEERREWIQWLAMNTRRR